MIDLLALLVLLVGAVIGARRGTVAMVLGWAAIAAGYAGAWLLYRPVGGFLERTLHLARVVALPLGWLLVLVVVTGVVKLIAWRVAARRAPAGDVARAASTMDRAGGALVGVAYAAVVVVVLAWAVGSGSALIGRGPRVADTLTGRLSARAIRAATGLIMRHSPGSPMATGLMSAITADPGAGVAVLNGVVGNDQVRRLWTDPALRKAVSAGDVQALAATPAMQALAGNRAFVDAAQRLGLVADGTAGAAALTQQLLPALRAVDDLRNDPDVRRQLDDPHIRQLLESRDVRGLMADRGFNALLGRLFTRLGRG